MITDFKKYEFYSGAYKAAGFKHFQEEGFAFIINTTKESLNEFANLFKTFSAHLKRMGIKHNVVIDDKDDFIMFIFPAVNQYEAYSITDQIVTYFRNKKIPILGASITPNLGGLSDPSEIFKKAEDITGYVKRKDYIKGQFGPKVASAMSKAYNKAYRTTDIGFKKKD